MKRLALLILALALLAPFVPQRMPCRLEACQPPPVCRVKDGPRCMKVIVPPVWR